MRKDFQVVLNDMEAPRIEVCSSCDTEVGRDLPGASTSAWTR
jgi:hypothetical protein